MKQKPPSWGLRAPSVQANEINDEVGPAVGRLVADLAAVGLDGGAADRQAKPGIFALTFTAYRIDTIEPVEQTQQAPGRSRQTLVLHAQAPVAEADADLVAIGGEVQDTVQ